VNGFYPVLNKSEMAYLRHKAWHVRPVWYWYIQARETPGGYLFMSGMELDKVIAILAARERLLFYP
jgi:hypothetical protein